MKYTAKHICKLFGINRETLRYYEKEGLLHPEIDEKNRYRYYDDWEINYILEIFQYRNLGFSIDEIRSLQEKDTLHDYIEKMKKRQHAMNRQMQYQEMITERSSEFLNSLEMIQYRLGTYELVYRPGIYTVPIRNNFELIFSEKYAKVYPIVLKNFEFFENAVHIPRDSFQKKTEEHIWGFAIEKRWADKIKIDTSNMEYVPEQLCIRTVLDASERWNFKHGLFEDGMQFILANNMELDGDIFGYLLARIHEEDRYCRFIEAYIPVKKTL